ncbi:hypothetical protein CONLIGDRAFT_679147 [Coniochaeta ligniaria NRRL 30616]|uniref:G-protein coupled receptors family 2 profile 2 domain-containing protein n=1 Tax=Coniochaeta ligniaria NRRL 30616 TaxID=1408157 RepID=A0A1J7JS06_9PEZI|nr:hypothetical protein CONLIGDRAFT_679147 [Coniochaeta ligniaria NRRL 30616]
MAGGSPFTDDQIFVLAVLERTGGSLSLFSVCLIFIAYALFERQVIRTVPNTFILFASVANAGASIASIIATDGLSSQGSSLCQAQAFLFEMFIQSDPWWSLAMAVNVVMVFFMNGNPHSIKKWGWLYCIVCYGGPLIVALVCLQLRAPGKGQVYGSAGLWCWITNDWNPLRIYTYYMLIWICILSSMVIYLSIGVYVFRVRNRLHQFSSTTLTSTQRKGTVTSPPPHNKANDWPLSPEPGADMYGTVNVVTEVRVTHTKTESSSSSIFPPISKPERAHHDENKPGDDWPRTPALYNRPLPPPPPGISTIVTSPLKQIQSTAPKDNITAQTQRSIQRVADRFKIHDPIKRAYLRTSFLFAVSVLVTWIPSSINRIRGMFYSDSPYAYNVGTATVLPLQGVWNAVIFFVMSWKILRESIADWSKRGEVVELTDGTASATHDRFGGRAARVRVWRDTSREEMELGMRPNTKAEKDGDGEDSWDFADLPKWTESADVAMGLTAELPEPMSTMARKEERLVHVGHIAFDAPKEEVEAKVRDHIGALIPTFFWKADGVSPPSYCRFTNPWSSFCSSPSSSPSSSSASASSFSTHCCSSRRT